MSAAIAGAQQSVAAAIPAIRNFFMEAVPRNSEVFSTVEIISLHHRPQAANCHAATFFETRGPEATAISPFPKTPALLKLPSKRAPLRTPSKVDGAAVA